MPSHTTKHRHFVAVPVAVLAVTTFFGVCTAVPLRADVAIGASSAKLSATETDHPFAVGRSVAGILREGSMLSADRVGASLTLQDGQVLLRTQEAVSLDLGIATVSMLRGSIVAVRDAGSVTIAVLTDPVLLKRGEELTLLQPGMQVTVQNDALRPTQIGSGWYAEQLADLATLPPVSDARTDIVDSVCSDSSVSTDDMRAALRLLLASGKITSEAYRCLRETAQAIDPSHSVFRLALTSLMTEGARTEDEASRMILDDVQNDAFLGPQLTLLVPELAVRAGKPVQPAFLDSYPSTLIKLGLTHPDRAIEALGKAQDLPSALTSAGLPLQSDAWRSVLIRSIVVLKTTVPDAERRELERILTHVVEVKVFAADTQTSSAPASVAVKAPSTHWSDAELQAIAHDVLASHGALFATTTTLTPDAAAQTVAVEGIYVLQNGSNVLYAFTYDPAAETVTRIIRDGKRYPNAVPVRVFFGS